MSDCNGCDILANIAEDSHSLLVALRQAAVEAGTATAGPLRKAVEASLVRLDGTIHEADLALLPWNK